MASRPLLIVLGTTLLLAGSAAAAPIDLTNIGNVFGAIAEWIHSLLSRLPTDALLAKLHAFRGTLAAATDHVPCTTGKARWEPPESDLQQAEAMFHVTVTVSGEHQTKTRNHGRTMVSAWSPPGDQAETMPGERPISAVPIWPFPSCWDELRAALPVLSIPLLALGGLAAIVFLVGFTPVGVVAGSLAASIQSVFYGAATGGLFSVFQALGTMLHPAVVVGLIVAGAVGLAVWKLGP
ncbi:uncharacterized protein BXZ73DRAFT_82439 [Epithele typhae]|uniref:uncharacterized protein n=1 Tax=Epithele typhae TaxID=378194 RepID=UPI002007D771|nr:uncharacterized protein BXZ73DRAFT_82439 [Epithele typhae]KAH9912142.1 hypothetical protein BXZ73DRAFT_82439 [Epithele typhae]